MGFDLGERGSEVIDEIRAQAVLVGAGEGEDEQVAALLKGAHFAYRRERERESKNERMSIYDHGSWASKMGPSQSMNDVMDL